MIRPLRFDLSGRVALVTGASGGLGGHFARVLAAHGATVVAGARRAAACAELCASIQAEGGKAFPVALDVTSSAAVESALATTRDLAGTVDILINNAGIACDGGLADLDEADWDAVLDTNLKGAFLMAAAVARELRQKVQGGAIVNIASILGLRTAGQVGAYAASKAGLIQLTRSMALEWARFGIRANALCPGYVETDLNREFFASEAGQALIRRIPSRRLGQLADLDGPLLLLCCDAGAAMTGSTLAVDGGHLVSSL